ncbi:hypothetical protein Z951_04390 [Streptomyces sp. PRh5]|nr:hypothetical protein Z951_04390 [Streptomyces sp. PRh5]
MSETPCPTASPPPPRPPLLLCGPAAAGCGGGADPGKQITDIDDLLAQDVEGLVVSPIDSATIAPGLSAARRAHVPVVAVDVAPDRARAAVVVRADNRAWGNRA